ncbi:hypothetical protein SEA_CASBAH_100 [Mycobacterium phage Casbah]|uniref:Uncharacterized protein n=1 Tax=Mycobacterium phage Obutu TaxID=2593350 RepID=A0A514TY79_9CAUD|nr:hypothetical protein KNU70_gp102 [Mycobacterium phage Obutu]QDK01630.1 hypothetical protein OBUTU_102 [Mycobacterium phage Obutu]WGH21884.1 hypothetical protein SEA_CASBAH_100 [Mycobacterium phage Casbah]WGH22201.1 hypothetical protein SEA_KRONUS_100 [Mycobacterium phage Kronus]
MIALTIAYLRRIRDERNERRTLEAIADANHIRWARDLAEQRREERRRFEAAMAALDELCLVPWHRHLIEKRLRRSGWG